MQIDPFREEIWQLVEVNCWAVCSRRVEQAVCGLFNWWSPFQQCSLWTLHMPKRMQVLLFQSGQGGTRCCSLSLKHRPPVSISCPSPARALLPSRMIMHSLRFLCVPDSHREQECLHGPLLLEWMLLSDLGPVPIEYSCWGILSVYGLGWRDGVWTFPGPPVLKQANFGLLAGNAHNFEMIS